MKVVTDKYMLFRRLYMYLKINNTSNSIRDTNVKTRMQGLLVDANFYAILVVLCSLVSLIPIMNVFIM